MHARALCEQASKQAASGSDCGSVASVELGSRRSQVADAAQGRTSACCSVGDSEGGESGQCWRPRPRVPLPEGGRPVGSSAPPIDNGSGGQGRPGSPGPEDIGGACRPPVPEVRDRQQAVPQGHPLLQTTLHAYTHTLGGATPAPGEGRADSPLGIVRRRGRLVPFSSRLFLRDVWARQTRGSPQIYSGGRAPHTHGVGPPFQISAQPAHPRGKAPVKGCLLYTSPSPRDRTRSRMPSSA